MDRTQRWLACLLGVQIVLLAIVHPPFARRTASAAEPLLPALASLTPRMLEIAAGDGGSIRLVRDSGGWSLAQPAGYPALADKVDQLLRTLKGLTAGRPVASSRRSHAALKVAGNEFERRLRVWEGGGRDPRLELYVGSSPGPSVTHVRVAGSDRVSEVSGLGAYDLPADAGSWVERRLVDLAAADVGGVEITNRRGSFALERRSGAWAVRAPAARANVALDQGKVNDLVGVLCGLTLDQPAGVVDEAGQGFSAPEATVVLARAPSHADSAGMRAAGAAQNPGSTLGAALAAPGPSVTIRIGAPVPGKQDQRFATRSGLAFAVTVPRYSIDRPDTVTLGELLKK